MPIFRYGIKETHSPRPGDYTITEARFEDVVDDPNGMRQFVERNGRAHSWLPLFPQLARTGIVHYDIVGHPLIEGVYVTSVVDSKANVRLFQITKNTPSKVKVLDLFSGRTMTKDPAWVTAVDNLELV